MGGPLNAIILHFLYSYCWIRTWQHIGRDPHHSSIVTGGMDVVGSIIGGGGTLGELQDVYGVVQITTIPPPSYVTGLNKVQD